MTLELHATPDEVMRAVDALQTYGNASQVTEKILFGLKLALEECASNIVNHSLRRNARQTFRVTLERVGNSMILELRDRGPEFDPTQVPVMGKEASHEGRPSGGLGVHLARHYTDEMRYRRECGENVLYLTKRLDASARPEVTLLQDTITETKPQLDKTMPLEIKIRPNVGGPHPEAVTVTLNGSLDTSTAPELLRRLSTALDGPVKDLVFDLAHLKFITSAGLAVFAVARNKLKERGGQPAFVNMQPQIKEVFDIMKALPPNVKIFQDQAELDSYLAVRQRSYQEGK